MNKEQILNRLNAVRGKVGFYYKNLVTGEAFGLNENQLFESASVIKLPIYAVIMKLYHEGTLSLTDKLTCHDWEKKPSCGALQFFSGDFEVEIGTLCALMITLSDNTATNMFIRHFGIDFFNEQFKEIGLEQSHIERFLFDPEASAEGKENRVTPFEMGMLLERIYRHTYMSEEISRQMETVLRKQQIKHKIRGYLPKSIPCMNKTGEDEGITNDVGLVYAPEHPFVVCYTFNQADVPEAERAIREITLELLNL